MGITSQSELSSLRVAILKSFVVSEFPEITEQGKGQYMKRTCQNTKDMLTVSFTASCAQVSLLSCHNSQPMRKKGVENGNMRPKQGLEEEIGKKYTMACNCDCSMSSSRSRKSEKLQNMSCIRA